jgi:hypothetical protein
VAAAEPVAPDNGYDPQRPLAPVRAAPANTVHQWSGVESHGAPGSVSRSSSHSSETTTTTGRSATDVSDSRQVGARGVVRANAHSTSESHHDGRERSQSESREAVVGRNQHGTGVSDAHREASSERHADGSGRSREAARSTATGYRDRTVTRTSESSTNTTETRSDGTQHARAQSTSSQSAIGHQGASHQSTSSSSREVRDAEGNTTERTASTVRGGGGITLGEHEVGANANSGGTWERTRNGTTTTASTDHAARVDNRGASYSGTGQGSVSRGPATLTGSVGAGASFRTDIEPIESSPGEPRRFRVVMTLRIHGNVGGRGRIGGGGVSVEGGVDLSRERTLRFEHTLDEAECVRYRAALADVERQQSPPARLGPEFVYMRQILESARRHGSGAAQVDVLSDPDAALGLRDGETLQMNDRSTTSGRTGASVDVGAVSVGGRVEGGRSQSRTIGVRATTVSGVAVREITVSWDDEESSGVSGHAGAGGFGGEASRRRSSGRGVTVVFQVRTEPLADYQRNFRRIVAARDRGVAQALARELGAELTRRESQSTTTEGGVGRVGADGLTSGLRQTETSTHSQEVTTGPGGTLRGSTNATRTSELDGRIGGHSAVRTRTATTATNEVDSSREVGDRQEVNVATAREQGVHLPEQLENGALGRLRDFVGANRRELDRYRISENDVEECGQRARQGEGAWYNSLDGGLMDRLRVPWLELRRQLANPQPEAEWVAADRDLAMRLARGRAMTHFIAAAPTPYGHRAIETLLRRMGGALGQHLEWPGSIRAREADYDRLHRQVLDARTTFAGYPEAGRAERVRSEVRRISGGLGELLSTVRQCQDFRSVEAMAETEEAILADQQRIQRIGREMAGAQTRSQGTESNTPAPSTPGTTAAPSAPSTTAARTPAASGPGTANASTSATSEATANASATPAAMTPAERQEAWNTTGRPLLQQLQSYRQRERAILDQVQAAVDTWHLTNGWLEACINGLNSVSQLMPSWRRALDRMRDYVASTGGDLAQLPVDARPDRERRATLLRRVVGAMPTSRLVGNPEERIALWRAEVP